MALLETLTSGPSCVLSSPRAARHNVHMAIGAHMSPVVQKTDLTVERIGVSRGEEDRSQSKQKSRNRPSQARNYGGTS